MITKLEMSFKAFLVCVFADIIFYLAKGSLWSVPFWGLTAATSATLLLFLVLWLMGIKKSFTKI
ncbi:MAG: hypothetical protein LUG66_04630 [Clostridiales bacterium]|nr:hypothetical protein [Clostridiales bacterium]